MDLMAGYSALTTALDLAKGLKDINDKVKLNAVVIELQSQIMTAQGASLEAQRDMASLQAKLAAFDAWESVASRYQLKDFGGSTFAYELRVEKADGEPSHRLCPNCFEKKQRSILQFSHRGGDHRDYYKCHSCDKVLEFGQTVHQDYSRLNRGSSWVA